MSEVRKHFPDESVDAVYCAHRFLLLFLIFSSPHLKRDSALSYMYMYMYEYIYISVFVCVCVCVCV